VRQRLSLDSAAKNLKCLDVAGEKTDSANAIVLRTSTLAEKYFISFVFKYLTGVFVSIMLRAATRSALDLISSADRSGHRGHAARVAAIANVQQALRLDIHSIYKLRSRKGENNHEIQNEQTT
jgi:hypothetical protein